MVGDGFGEGLGRGCGRVKGLAFYNSENPHLKKKPSKFSRLATNVRETEVQR